MTKKRVRFVTCFLGKWEIMF